MSVENFTYTGSPWGYTAPGWTVFQRSSGVSPRTAESYMPYFRYTGGAGGPVQFVYAGMSASGARIAAQSVDSGLRWYDESRGHDYFAHVYVEAQPTKPRPSFNPMSLCLSPCFQREFPPELKQKALDILKGARAKEEPPALEAVPAFDEIRANPDFSADAVFKRLSQRAAAKLAQVAAAIASRATGGGGQPVLFDASNANALTVAAAALAVLPPSVRQRLSFATYVSPGSLGSTSLFSSFAFAGTDLQGMGCDRDTGFAGALPDPGFSFSSAEEAARCARIADSCGDSLPADGLTAIRFVVETVRNEKNGGMSAAAGRAAPDFSCLQDADVLKIVDAFRAEGLSAREILARAAKAAGEKYARPLNDRIKELRSELSMRRKELDDRGPLSMKCGAAALAGCVLAGAIAGCAVSKFVWSDEEAIINLHGKIEEIGAERDEWMRSAKDFETANGRLKGDNDEFRERIKSLSAQLGERQVELEASRKKLEALRKKCKEPAAAGGDDGFLRTQNANLQKEKADLQRELSDAKARQAREREASQKWCEKYRDATNQIARMKIEAAEKSPLDSLPKDPKAKEDKLDKYAGELKDRENQLKKERSSLEDEKSKVAKGVERIREKEAEIADDQSRINARNAELDRKDANLLEREKLLQEWNDELDKREKGLQADYDKRKSELEEEYEKKNANLESIYQDKHKKLNATLGR